MGQNSLDRLRQQRAQRAVPKQDEAEPPKLPKETTELYSEHLPPDVAYTESKVAEVMPSGARAAEPQPAPRPHPNKPVAQLTSDDDLPIRVEARVSEAEAAVIKQVIRKRKNILTAETGELSGYNRQDLVREALLALCRQLDTEFDDKVSSLETALKVLK
tara:strand:- start:22278 stop:22757 length:480 start_codon:yes stop_codon:yes gene_type:complete